MDAVISCDRGVEAIVMEELASLGWESSKLKSSKVLIRNVSDGDIALLNLYPFTVNRVYLLLGEFQVPDLREIRRAAETIDYSTYLKPRQTFGVVGRRQGSHDFTSVDVARETGTAITRHFELFDADERPVVHLNDPDVQFVAELSGSNLLLMINTSGQPLQHRIKRPFIHTAGLKPPLAAALLHLSSWKEMGGFLDPFAGGGTIPMVAYMQCTGRIPGMYYDHEQFLFRNLRFLDPETIRDKLQSAVRTDAAHPCPQDIRAGDRFMKSVSGMKQNLAHFGWENNVTLYHGIAENLNYLEDDAVKCIVTNPPYGLRIGSPHVIDLIYQNFAQACARKGIREVTALTPRKRSWLSSFRKAGYKEDLCMKITFGNLPVFIIRVKSPEKRKRPLGT